MVHDFLGTLLASTPPSSVDTSGIKIALITAISVVVAAAITAFATTFQRRHAGGGDDSQTFIAELLRRAEVAERRADTFEQRNDSLNRRVDELEATCWRAGVDPSTGNPVRQGVRREGPPNGTASSA